MVVSVCLFINFLSSLLLSFIFNKEERRRDGDEWIDGNILSQPHADKLFQIHRDISLQDFILSVVYREQQQKE